MNKTEPMLSWGIICLKDSLETISLTHNPILWGSYEEDDEVYCYTIDEIHVLNNMFDKKTAEMTLSEDANERIEQAKELQKEIVTEYFANKNYCE